MKIKWCKLIPKLLFWLSMEILLNFLNLDELADSSEFVDKRPQMMLMS